MKHFFKTLLNGFELMLIGGCAIACLYFAVSMIIDIHNMGGWLAILAFFGTVICIAGAISVIFVLGLVGNVFVEHSNNKEEE